MMKVAFGRWTAAKGVLAVVGGLAIAGAVGSAIAMSPTIAPPIKWAGGWESVNPALTGNAVPVFTVPAGKNLLVSDLVAGNVNNATVNVSVASSTSADCTASLVLRMAALPVPPITALNVPLQSGIGFASGQRVCINAFGGLLNVTLRGFLFTPAPS